MQDITSRSATAMRKSVLWIQAAVIAAAGLVPVLMLNSASATTEDLLNREATVTNAIPGASFDITFQFDTTAHDDGALAVQGAEFEFVDDPLASYSTDPANTPNITSASTQGESGWLTTADATAFGAATTAEGDNYTGGGMTTNNQLVVTRADTDDQRSRSSAQVSFTGLTHNATANRSFYVRVRLYSDQARTPSNLRWQGVVAQSTSQTLNVSARVQERLVFCVGSTITNNTTSMPETTAPADITSCADMNGTNVDLGVVDSDLTTSPVPVLDGGNITNGIAMVNTNAVNGTVISYSAIQESAITTGAGKLKVDGVECIDNTSVVDQCFNSVGATQAVIVAGTEKFGMTIGGVNCGSAGTAYTCIYADGDTNLDPATDYTGGTYVQTTSGTFGSASGFAWDDSTTYTPIASSSGSAIKVIDDEALILVFGATAGATTPTGTYDVDVDFVATPTF
jgi:hypothetical protein